jgi:transposase
MYRLPKRLVQALLSDLYGVELSLGCISKAEKRTSEVLAEPVASAHEHVKQAAVVHADETGWKERGQKAWLWLAATTTVAVFLIQPRRTMQMAKHLLGSAFAGWLITDRFGSYGFVDALRRQLCWAHLLRDIEAFRLYGRGGKQLATQLQRPARTLIGMHHRVRDGTLSRRAFRHKARPLRREILYHLRRGAGWRNRSIAGVCSQILKLEDALFSFVDHEGIEPTNNHAERLARHPVLWRKSSFGTDSETGSRFVERILTVVATLRLQHRNVLDYVTDACRASLHHQSPPSLLPTPLHSLHVSQAA